MTLILKGKEKASQSEFDAACEELCSKLASIIPIYFSNIDFILSYAAAGSYICFFALNCLGTLFPLTNQLNLTIRVDRLQAIRAVTNIICIMITIKDTLPTNVLPLGCTLKRVIARSLSMTILLRNVFLHLIICQCKHA